MENLQDRNVGLDRLSSQLVDNLINSHLDPSVVALLSEHANAPVVQTTTGRLVTKTPEALCDVLLGFADDSAAGLQGQCALQIFAACLGHV